MNSSSPFSVFTVSSYRHLHAVQLFQSELRGVPGVSVIDWTQFAPRLSMPREDRRRYMDVGQTCLIPEICEKACATADLVIYYGDSGKDSAVLVGMAKAIGTPVMGIAGPLEEIGLALHSAVALWAPDPFGAIESIKLMARCRMHGDSARDCKSCPAEHACAMAANFS